MQQKIVAFVWAWWSWKSTHAARLREIFWLPTPTNYTTRNPRGKKDTDYKFINQSEFNTKIKNKELFNQISFDNNLYWFDKNITKEQKLIISIIPQTIDDLEQYTKDRQAALLKILFQAPEDVLKKRILSRGVSKEEADKRIQIDKDLFTQWPQTYDDIIDSNKPKEEVFENIREIVADFFHTTKQQK